MVWNVFFVFIFGMCVNSNEGFYQPAGSSAIWGYFTPPLVQREPLQSEKTPMEAMVELTNDLGVAILQDHSFSKGNFAFSPYGVASVLVVLYEGARGESARQIHRAIGFPLEKDIIRVGFRDIHRHLRDYFSHEGHLSGICLNKQSSSLKYEFKKTLKFYGYDIDVNQSFDDYNISETSSSNPEYNTTTVNPIGDDVTNTIKDTEGTTLSISTIMGDISEMTTPVMTTLPITEEYDKTTTGEFGNKESDKPNIKDTTTTMLPVIKDKTTILPPSELEDGTTIFPITEPQEETTVTTTTEEFEININIDNNIDCKDQSGCDNNKGTTSFIEQTETTPLSDETGTKITVDNLEGNSNLDNGMLIPQPNDPKTTSTEKYSIETTKIQDEILPEAFPQLEEKDGAEESKINKNINAIMKLITSRAFLWLTEKGNHKGNQMSERKIRTITDYLKSPHNLDLSLQLQNGMFDTHVSRNSDSYIKLPKMLFLVDGAVDTPVPMMIHTHDFSYAYIPRLHSKALEFPLDDTRYKLLILLPVERRGLKQLLYDLLNYPLSNVIESMKPERVKVMIPTFMVEGFVILTSSLQKLGIWDVFDPRKANLSGMSMDPELYVRNVEQSVTVVIRNYVEILDIQTRTMAARQIEYEFKATHPFIYFVLDTATNVALMAGQILDPLNSRIY